MGERKGQNKYYPPDFDYKVHKSLAGYHGQHPLRERARKLDRGILIIRFEMPYNIWCDGCNNHIGMGVRYNAEKSKDGMYYTTPIYKFRMKCHLCNNHFEIKTDPANHDYVIISGARRKEQRWDPHENEQIVPEDRTTQKQLALNAMYKLEHGEQDQTKGKSKQSAIAQILEHQERQRDDFALNQLARKQFRDAKKSRMNERMKDEAITKKFGNNIQLLKEHPDDVQLSKLLKFSAPGAKDDKPTPGQCNFVFQSKNKASSSNLPASLTRKEISMKRLKQIASSEVSRKRKEAFSTLFAKSTSAALGEAEEISSKTLLSDEQKSDLSVGSMHSIDLIVDFDTVPCSSTEEAACGAVTSATPANEESLVKTVCALNALRNEYTNSTDDDGDDDSIVNGDNNASVQT